MKRHRLEAFLAAVFAIKLIAVLQLRDHVLLQADTGLDTTLYTQLATRVAAGDLTLGPGLYSVSPLYIYVLAAVVASFKTFAAARLVQIVLGTAAVGFVFGAARAWFGRRAAWIAATLAALTGLFTFYESVLLQSSLDPFLTAAALACLAAAFAGSPPRRDSRVWWFAATGLVLGIQVLNRPNVLIPAAGMAALLAVQRRWRPAAFVLAGLVAALLPAAVRNYAVAGDWSPASSHGGLNFYIGNNANADGAYRPVPGITPNMQGQQEDARHVASAAVGRTLDDGEVSAYFYDLGWTWIRLHPGSAAKVFARKILFLFNAGFISLNYSYPFYAYDERTVLAVLFVGPWLLIPLGLAGLVAGGFAVERRADYLVWASFVPLYALSVATFFVTERYRLPLLVPFCIGAGYAIDLLSTRTRSFRLQAEVAAAAIAIAILANWPLHQDDGRAEERTRMAEAMIVHDRIEDAEAWGARAAAIHPHPAVVHLRMARLLIVHSRPDAAIAHLRTAEQIDPADPTVAYAMGQALVDAGRPKEALPYLERALSGGARADLAGYDLARARAALGDRAGALEALQSVRPADPTDASAWQALGQFALELESPPLATTFLSQAVTAAPRASKPRQDLGLALGMMGRVQEAIAQFEQAAALDPADPAAQLNLAVAYAQAGRIADARARAQEALRLNPRYERARQMLERLR